MSGGTRLSVALCTYNGARHLGEQLASLERQTRAPDELVVCDDGSSDGTLPILDALRERVPYPVRVVVNATRLGPTKNFEQAIGLCTGDLIALSDQDDVWLPERLALGEAALAADAGAGLAFSDATMADEALRPLGYDLWDAITFTEEEQARVRGGDAVPVLLRHQVVTGATMTFRAALRPAVLPVPPCWIHDGWIAFLAAATGRLVPLPEPLVLYRQHDRNLIGARRRGLLDLIRSARRPGAGAGLLTDLERFRAVRDWLARPDVPLVREDACSRIDDAIAHLEVRARLDRPRLRRVWPVLREATTGRYRRYSRGAQSVVQDLLW